jgi:predicted kinase
VAPTLLLVGGTHGAGKTTLASLLSQTLSWPLLSRDHVRGGLAWTAGEHEQEPAGELSKLAVQTFFALMEDHVSRGVSLVAESAFRRGVSEDDLRPLLPAADMRWIHCHVPRQTAIERCRTRSGREFVAPMLEGRDELRWQRVENPPRLPIPVLTVDTTDHYDPGLDEIVSYATRTRLA